MKISPEIINEAVIRQSIRPIQRAYTALYKQLNDALAMIEWLQEKPHNYWGA